jgi:hypothetical protein
LTRVDRDRRRRKNVAKNVAICDRTPVRANDVTDQHQMSRFGIRRTADPLLTCGFTVERNGTKLYGMTPNDTSRHHPNALRSALQAGGRGFDSHRLHHRLLVGATDCQHRRGITSALAQPGEQIDLRDRGGRAILLADERFDAEHLVEHRLGHLGEPALGQLAGMSS